MHALLLAALRAGGLSEYDGQAALDAPAVHLLSTAQWRGLLAPQPAGAAALDVGAGSGHITEQLAPCFTAVRAAPAQTAHAVCVATH